jgi:amidase
MPDLTHTTRLYVELLAAAFIGPDLSPEPRQRLAAEAAALSAGDDSLQACRLRGIVMSHNDWVMATRTRFGNTARWRALFRDIDAILSPAMPTPAFLHDHSPIDERLLDVDGTAARYADQIVWATIATLNGLPATTLPIARSPEGLPIGAQLIGAFLEDRTTIALAGMIERALGCAFTPPPGY